MVRNFSDHAANERTFLAWVRTAIAIMAFGFLVEKFDLFLQFARASLALRVTSPLKPGLGEAAGIGLMVFGLAIVAVAAVRFLQTAKEIDSPGEHPGAGSKLDLALAVLLLLLGGALLVYLVYSLVKVG